VKASAILALSVAVTIGMTTIASADQAPYPIPEYEAVATNSALGQRALATARQEMAQYPFMDAEAYQGFVMRSARSVAVTFIKPGGCDGEPKPSFNPNPILVVELDLDAGRVLDSHFTRDSSCKSSL